MIDYPDGEICRYSKGITHPLVARLPHYTKWVPKDWEDNWQYRLNIRHVAKNNPGMQKRYWQMCQEDFLFWLNSFAYLVEPRIGEEHQGLIPFCSWSHQDPPLAALDYYFGTRHLVGHKSRAQGASWAEVANFVHKFIFRPYTLLGMGSKNEESADSPDNPDSLGWKFDFIMKNLPAWMRPPEILLNEKNRKLTDHTWKNVLNGSTLKAYSATAGIGRPGRFTSFFLDESAFFPPGSDSEAVSNLLNTTNGLVMLSTPNGMNNEHYDRVHNPGPWLTLVLFWEDNPVQSKGMYTTAKGKLKVLDESYRYPDDYKFVLDGRHRSPWFDKKCEENKNNMLLVGQELCLEYMGSKGRPFPKETIEAHLGLTRPPLLTGDLMYYEHEPENATGHAWAMGEAYNFDLWVPLDHEGNLPLGHYVVGCDISAGVGGDVSSYSAMEIFNGRTREQVGEFIAHELPPEKFASYVLATCWWLGHGTPTTHLIWEKNGPGIRFTNNIVESNYPNVYYSKASPNEIRRSPKKTDRPGYSTSNTQLTLTPLIAAMCSSSVTLRSRALVEECSQYIFDKTGRDVEHPRSKTSRDGGSSGLSHGDRAIAAAVAIRAMDERPMHRNTFIPDAVKIVPNSMAGRWEQRQDSARNHAREMCKW